MNRSDFDEFLFAPLGDEKNGMTLRVVSALARLGFDPWGEAARLSTLPKAQATMILAGLFARLPDAAVPSPLAAFQAARLVALLPAPVPSRGWFHPARLHWPRLGASGICLVVVLAAFVVTLTAQSCASRNPSPPASISARP